MRLSTGKIVNKFRINLISTVFACAIIGVVGAQAQAQDDSYDALGIKAGGFLVVNAGVKVHHWPV